jgi:hypothetical protein
MPLGFYLSDIVMLLAALVAAVSAWRQGHAAIVPRWRLLLPGVLATIATIGLISFPRPIELLNPEMHLIGAACFLVGGARGAFMGMESDQAWGLVRVQDSRDGVWAALALALFATLNFAAEMITQNVNPYMISVELLMTIPGSYLMGRSLVSWIRAGRMVHADLRD